MYPELGWDMALLGPFSAVVDVDVANDHYSSYPSSKCWGVLHTGPGPHYRVADGLPWLPPESQSSLVGLAEFFRLACPCLLPGAGNTGKIANLANLNLRMPNLR